MPNDKGDKLRSEIVVDQMRDLGHWFSLTPQMGAAQVAMITPADAMNANAANALLKTLEEPSRDRYLLLVTDRPGRLPATIRSRCQRLEFRPPGKAEAMAWLRTQGHGEAALAPALARRARPSRPGLRLAGHRRPGAAPAGAGRAQRAVGQGGSRRSSWRSAGSPTNMRRCACASPPNWRWTRPPSGWAPARPRGLTVAGDFQMLSAWFDGINRTREQLSVPALRHDLALAGLLLEWRSMSKATAMQGARR